MKLPKSTWQNISALTKFSKTKKKKGKKKVVCELVTMTSLRPTSWSTKKKIDPLSTATLPIQMETARKRNKANYIAINILRDKSVYRIQFQLT